VFTGLIEEVGTLLEVPPPRVRLAASRVRSDLAIGDSVALDGCCLTVVELGEGWFAADVAEETLRRTTLGRRRVGDGVNLERPLRVGDRLGGHLVQGHVDAVATVVTAPPWLGVRVPEELRRFVAEKGSIALDGVSLTVAAWDGEVASVALIPHTASQTTLGRKVVGDEVNVEVDLLARYLVTEREDRGS